MAVVRSIAFQNARKSIGQQNYYRRKGVQLVRTKATFAPDRTFTESQKVQQSKMAAVQYALKELHVSVLAPFANTNTIKRYNAATPLNRLTSNMLHGIDDVINWEILPPDQILKDRGVRTFGPFNTGNYYLRNAQIKVMTQPTAPSGSLSFEFRLNGEDMNFMRMDIERKIRSKQKFDIFRFGFCGVFQTYSAPNNVNGVIYPATADDWDCGLGDGDMYQLAFTCDYLADGIPNVNTELELYTWLFYYTGTINNAIPTDGNAIYSTRSVATDYQTYNVFQDWET